MAWSNQNTTKSVNNLRQSASPHQEDASTLDSSSIVALYPADEQDTLYNARNLVYQDCVEKSGILPEIYKLGFPCIIGDEVYEFLFEYRDRATNSNSSGGSSIEAARHLALCRGEAGYWYKGSFYLPSDLCGKKGELIKRKGTYRPAGEPVSGFVVNGRFRQLGGPPLAFDRKSTGEWEPRRYHQRFGKTLEVFFCPVTERVWEMIAAKANLPMPSSIEVTPDGEAIGFWEWVISSGCPVVPEEGEKKAAALISRGYAAIGLPGIYTGYRVTKKGDWVFHYDQNKNYQKAIERELHAAFKPFDSKNRLVTIVFDYRAGDYSQSPEFKAASITAKLFENAVVNIAQLPGPQKGADDFIVAGGDIDAVIDNAKSCKELAKLELRKQWRNSRKYTPDVVINAQYFYAPEPAAGTITGIKSGLNTGKTQHLKDVIASNPNGKIIVIGSRNGLLLQTAEKCGFYHLDAHNGYVMLKNPDARICLCFDSLLKLPPEIFEGATIIWDEAESVARHLLMSSTLKHNREAIKERFAQACKDASRIILLDGHLTDYTVNLVAKLAGNKTVTKHLNEFKGNCPKVSVYKTENGKLSAAEEQDFINKMLASECPVIATDRSVAEAEALAMTLTARYGKGLLICSKNSNDPDQIEFQTNPDAYIRKYNPAWIIYTPTLENGLDISIRERFTDVFGFFCGNLGVNSLIQMLRRVRHPMNQISVLCPEIGLINSERRSYYANQVRLQIETNINIEMALLAPEEYREAIQADILRQFNDPLFHAYCDYEAQENLEKSDLKAFLVEALRDGGYEVDEPITGGDESGDHANKKIACKEKESQEIFDAPDISLEEAQEISRRNKARWPERCQAEKAFLKAKLPGIEDTQLWRWEFVHRVKAKDTSLLPQLENSWLFHNPEDAEYLQKSKWETGKLETFLPDHNSRWVKLKALHKLDITQFLNPDCAWTNASPEIQKLLKDGGRKDARKILGETGNDGIKYANKLLGLIGVKLIAKQQSRTEDGKRTWEYRYQPIATWKETGQGTVRTCSLPEDWSLLAQLTAARMSQKVEAKKAVAKSTETLAICGLDVGTDDADFINNKTAPSVPAPTPEPTSEPILEQAPEPIPEQNQPSTPTTPQTTQWQGWVSRWHLARVLGWCEYGTRWVVEYLEANGNLGEMQVDPKNFVWGDGGASC
jgi:hypothetical protein